MMATPKRDREVTVETHRDGHRRAPGSSGRTTWKRFDGSGTSTSSRVAGSTEASARAKAEALGAARRYGSYEALLDDPDVQVVHNATPNYLHYPINAAAIAEGQARRLRQAAGDDGGRGAKRCAIRRRRRASSTPSRSTIAATRSCSRRATRSPAATSARRTSSSATTCRTGCSRTRTTRGGSSPTRAARRRRSATSARTGATWRSTSAGCASRTCSATSRRSIPKRKKPKGSREAFAAAGGNEDVEIGRHQGRGSGLGAAAVRQRRQGQFSGRPGLRRAQERSRARGLRGEERRSAGARSTRTSSGSATATSRTRSCRRIRRCSMPRCARYAHLPGGHQEAWADAFCNLMRDIYGVHRRRKDGDAIRIRRRLPRSKTAIAPTASSTRFSTAPRAACGPR